jgi:serine/threonine protein phosphatase PrpC
MKISTATAKGARYYQEDRSFVLPTEKGMYLGVFDGHGGSECAEYCANRMPDILAEFPDVFLALEALSAETRGMYAGSTASIVFIPKDEYSVHVAVIGDSPVIVKRADGSIWVSPEHNVRTNMAEADAAIARGGFVSGGYLFASFSGVGLQMSRALGDASLDKVLLRTPDMAIVHGCGAGNFVLVCTDGAVDPSHANEAEGIASIVSLVEGGYDAQQIVDRALAIPTRDNVTALLVTL